MRSSFLQSGIVMCAALHKSIVGAMLKMPVLILWGQEDHIMPVDQAEKMHRLIPQSELDIVPGCGHLAPLECTGRLAPEVIQFVQR